MGTDGAEGAKAIHSQGGLIFVQDEETSVVWGMPGNVVKLDLADRILPLAQIPTELTRAVEASRQPALV
jgi:two-component system chemotaxis response regulator CheB